MTGEPTNAQLQQQLQEAQSRYRALEQEINQCRQAERELQESELKYRTLIETSNDAIFLADKETGIIIDANHKASELLQKPIKEIIGLHQSNLHPPEELENCKQIFQEHIASGRAVSAGLYLQAADGKKIPVEISASVTEIHGRTIVQGVFRDITERYKMEQALRNQMRQNSIILQSTMDGYILADAQGKIMEVNQAYCDMSGYSRQELAGMNIKDLEACLCEEEIKERIQHYLKAGRARFETQHRRKDGEIIDLDVSLVLLEPIEPPMFTAFIRDITGRKKLGKERLISQKLESVAQLAGGIAHDFNNLLTAILGNISLAQMEMPVDSPVLEQLRDTEKATMRAKDLTQQLLTFSKGGAPVKKVLPLPEILTDSTGFALRGSNVRCEYQFDDNLWAAEYDPGQIAQVAQNIVINSSQAMQEGGTVTITAVNVTIDSQDMLPLKSGRYIRIAFQDHGIGIPTEHLHKIFDPYFSSKKRGSGLGLAVAYSIIKQHDGHIAVESHPGSGTIFTVYLPATEKTPTRQPAAQEEMIQGVGKVLVMDDEETVRDIASRMLTRLGYQTAVARDGKEAIDLYKKAETTGQPFTAVIMDLTIPGGMGGQEAVRQVLKLDPAATVIVSSGYANDPVMSNFMEYGFKGVVPKPYKMGELSKALQLALQQ